ncbi:hypothetical protein CAPTEDRAFT_195499 [Capitella teleta]|uniref:G-protein coupled receptors family 1 profile domain-containing protein n=1 Tax=Capitella teleta TaxID=283909 RepID=R7V5H5_CAPTE|nr:hypothetical protein CAPTEDRAFT_195499 [Capitella teleta]|eukprot:ELU13814.1 hypothetical protein CAPTEDRAFT_195499 [Capitella teleta]
MNGVQAWSNSTKHATGLRVSSICLLCCLSIVGTIGHCFLIFTLIKDRHYRYRCRCLIINISVLSLLCDAINIPMYVVNLIAGRQFFPYEVCKAIGYFSSFFFVALLANCLTIALDRCGATSSTVRGVNKRRTHCIIAFLWIVPAGLTLCGLPFLGYNDNQLHCIYEEATGVSWYSKVLVALPTTGTLVVICLCYIRICRKVVQSRNNILRFKKPTRVAARPSPVPLPRRMSTSVPNLREPKDCSMVTLADLRNTTFSQSMNSMRDRIVAWSDSHERELRLTIQLMVNFTLFVLLWFPLTILYFLEGFVTISPDIWLCCAVLARVFTTVNWGMYGLWSRPVRHSCFSNTNSVFVCCFKSHAKMRKTRVESIRVIQEQFKQEVKRFSQGSRRLRVPTESPLTAVSPDHVSV